MQAIRWKQIGSLAALNAAIVISWMAYFNYQVKVLDIFDLDHLGFFLVVAQGIIMVLIPPIAGLIGDYMIRKNSNYFVVYTIGISVTAMVFMAVAFTLQNSHVLLLRSAFPFMIVLWLISMNIFHSPANSMLELFAPAQDLPKVMALIAVITELLMALEPVIIILIDRLGPPLTFLAGGVALIVTGYIFRKVTGKIELKRESSEHVTKTNMFPVVKAGLMFGLIIGIINNNAFADLLSHKLTPYKSDLFGTDHFISLILAVAAVLAFPVIGIVRKRGLSSSLSFGVMIGLISFILIKVSASAFVCILGCALMGAGLSICSVTAFPIALQNLSPRQVTFGTGIFFGCSELINGILNIYFYQS